MRAPKVECIELEARLNIAQAVDLHRTLAAGIAKGGPMLLDGSRVEEIDTAVLQLLAAAWRSGRERKAECQWRGASEELRATAHLLGMGEMLDLPRGGPAPGRDDAAP